LFGDPHGGFEGAHARLTADDGRLAGADAIEKRLDLRLQGIALLEALFFDGRGQLPRRRIRPLSCASTSCPWSHCTRYRPPL